MRWPLICCALLASAGLARAEDNPKPADAEKVAASGLKALSKPDWKAYAELLHPDALKEFRDAIVPALKAADKKAKVDGEVLAIFSGAKDVDTVLSWKEEDFFVRVMSSLSRVPQTDALFTSRKAQVVGCALEGKELAHVVTRMTVKVDKDEMKFVTVVTLKLHKGKWKLLADDLVLNLAKGVKQTLELQAP